MRCTSSMGSMGWAFARYGDATFRQLKSLVKISCVEYLQLDGRVRACEIEKWLVNT